MENSRASVMFVIGVALSLILALAMRRPARGIHLPADTMAIWG